MGHAAVENGTPCACGHLRLHDDAGRTFLVARIHAAVHILGACRGADRSQ